MVEIEQVFDDLKSYFGTIKISPNKGMRRYGYYRRNGKRFIRNYGRNIKNGLSLLDLVRDKLKESRDEMYQAMIQDIYGSPGKR